MASTKPLEQMLVELEQNLGAKKGILAGSDGVYQFDIEGVGVFQLSVRDGQPKILVGAVESADVTLIVSEENFRKMLDREVNPTMLFMNGQLRIEGDIMKAMKLQTLL